MAHYPTPPKSAYSVKGLCGACESETLDSGRWGTMWSWSSCLFVCQNYMYNIERSDLIERISKLNSKFLLFSSPEPKAQVSFSDQFVLSVVIVENFSHFHLLLQNHQTNFNQTWHKASFGEGDSYLFK